MSVDILLYICLYTLSTLSDESNFVLNLYPSCQHKIYSKILQDPRHTSKRLHKDPYL